MEFVSAGSRFVRPRVSTPDGRPVSTTFFEVPLDGFSADGHMYVFRTTEHYREAGREVMGRSILTRAVNGDPTNLVCLYDLSIAREGGKFINVSCVVADDGVEGLPFGGPAVLVWGSGLYRASDAYFACVPLGDVEDRSRWRFWCGSEARSRRAVWSENESDAVALFAHPQIGELSVTWNAALGVWLLLYNAGSPRGINARVASHPWGPWSDPVVVFDPGWAGTGYGEFMHVQDAPDGLSDPGRENEWGGEYGPYVIDRYTRALPPGPGGGVLHDVDLEPVQRRGDDGGPPEGRRIGPEVNPSVVGAGRRVSAVNSTRLASRTAMPAQPRAGSPSCRTSTAITAATAGSSSDKVVAVVADTAASPRPNST